jgi:hypothetical protein
MTKIVRTPTNLAGGITPEEKVRLDAHAQLWIKRAMRTDPIDPDKIIPAIEALYAAANLKKPRVVIVPSPLVMAFAYGAAAAIWHRRKNGEQATWQATRQATDRATRQATDQATWQATDQATRQATWQATWQATDQATRQATWQATDQATWQATDQATRQATDQATWQATDQATWQATDQATSQATDQATWQATSQATDQATRQATDRATRQATWQATSQATDQATWQATSQATDQATWQATDQATSGAAQACRALAGDFGLACAARWTGPYQGGNMWAASSAYISAFRDVLGLRLPEHAAFDAWKAASIHGGFRVMHEEFCIVSDFPEFIRIDDQNRPHCETGPSYRWRDGWSLYYWHGVAVPAHWIEDRANLDPAEVIKAENVEQRAAGAAIVGWPKMLSVLKQKVINDSGNDDIGALIELTLPGLNEPGRFLKARCPRNGLIVEGVPRISDIDGLPINTALAAQAWRIGDPQSEYQHPPRRT